jgi:hypothetical protein
MLYFTTQLQARDVQGCGTSERREPMPDKKHLNGVSAKEQREYEHILKSAKEDGRYKGREKEVAARTVMKQHAEKGHSDKAN